MTARIWTAYLVELSKTARLRMTYVGPVLVLLAVLGAPLVQPVVEGGNAGYSFVAYVTPVALSFLGFLLLLAFCAGLVSAEIANGSIRQCLVRPLHRFEYLLAKLLMGVTYGALLLVVVALASWGTAAVLGSLRGVTFGGEIIYGPGEMLAAYAIGGALFLAPLSAGAAYAVMISTCTRSPVAAVSTAVGTWIVVDMVKYPLGIDRFVFTTFLESPWLVFSKRCEALEIAWFPMAGYCLASSGVALAAFSAVALVVFERRNLSR